MAYEVKSKKPMVTKSGPKNIGNKPQPRDPYKKQQPREFNKSEKPKASTIKKKKSLKYMSISDFPDKRMYRLSIIFGSTVLCDTFIVNEPFATSVVQMRDGIALSYNDLTKLLDKSISGGMIPRPFTKIWEGTHKGIMEGENNDIIHTLTRDVFTPGPNTKDIEFPTVVSYNINPGTPSKKVTKRIVVRLNYVTNPNFEPKKKEVKEEKDTPFRIVSKKKTTTKSSTTKRK